MKLRAPGTCEHIWSAWLYFSREKMHAEQRAIFGESGFYQRRCEICGRYQSTDTTDGQSRLEERALSADLTSARPPR